MTYHHEHDAGCRPVPVVWAWNGEMWYILPPGSSISDFSDCSYPGCQRTDEHDPGIHGVHQCHSGCICRHPPHEAL